MFTFLLQVMAEEELAEAIREAINEMRNFRLMYMGIWIPMFTALILVSLFGYLQYKAILKKEEEESGRTFTIRKDVHDILVTQGKDSEAYINKIIEESLRTKA